MTKKPASSNESVVAASSAAALSAYRRLLRVLPMAFRSEYEEEMLATFCARYIHAARNSATNSRVQNPTPVRPVCVAWVYRAENVASISSPYSAINADGNRCIKRLYAESAAADFLVDDAAADDFLDADCFVMRQIPWACRL